jgi:cation diffusion facilitator CzcD-associated flavoprotein CzcO
MMLYGTKENEFLFNLVEGTMRARLANRPDLMEKLIPKYPVGCRRLTPGDGYLEALQANNVRPCFSDIKRITEKGIITRDGEEEEFDLIVCATGFDTTFTPRWDLVGRDGRRLEDDWSEVPEAYLSMCAANMPNYFLFSGPNAPIGHGSVPQMLAWSADYMLDWIKKMATEDIKYVC